jgi:hypothetical protein
VGVGGAGGGQSFMLKDIFSFMFEICFFFCLPSYKLI